MRLTLTKPLIILCSAKSHSIHQLGLSLDFVIESDLLFRPRPWLVKSRPQKFTMKRVASIDIGTNTILLLIAEVGQDALTPLFEQETVVGLGKGLRQNGYLSPEAMDRAYETLGRYRRKCRKLGVGKVFAAGTSALREARNSAEFLDCVQQGLDLSIEVISGEKEAQLSFIAVARDLKEPEKAILVIDVGGGSTEWILGKGDRILQWVSLPIGSVRFTEEFLISDPVKESEWKKMEQEIAEKIGKIPPGEPAIAVAVGGTATTVASVELGLKEFRMEEIHHFELSREALRRQLLLYRSKNIQERKKIPGLPANRADVILAGAAILNSIVEKLGHSSILISCHGIRHGLLYQKLGLR